MAIDVSDRDPKDQPDGIPYELLAESCVPGINTTDFASIFEEQTVIKRLELNKVRIFQEFSLIFILIILRLNPMFIQLKNEFSCFTQLYLDKSQKKDSR